MTLNDDSGSEKLVSPLSEDTASPLPDDTWTIPEIKEYLDAHQIAYKSSDNKTDLLAKIGG